MRLARAMRRKAERSATVGELQAVNRLREETGHACL